MNNIHIGNEGINIGDERLIQIDNAVFTKLAGRTALYTAGILGITGAAGFVIFKKIPKLKARYYNWKVNKLYNKIMNDPNINEEEKEEVKQRHEKYLETKNTKFKELF